ncbi:MAG: sulfatase-like hydrolase/transferase, partial [Hyphomicrobiales bacterium]|nr:sulfatase-like hydrolase/transferase [Hyphomicrobiales bacterium]
MRRLRIWSGVGFLYAAATFVSVSGYAQGRTPQGQAPVKDLPNILLIIADDMGVDASPCYGVGAAKPDMPVLKRMCAEGIVFENAYANPVCSSTRATLLTGRYSFRTGVGTVTRPGIAPGLKLSERTIFQFLDAATSKAYTHAVIGKWHLSDENNGGALHPQKAGAGYYAGVLQGALRDYYNWPRTHNGKTSQVSAYITSSLTRESLEWINSQRKPWFLWLAHVAPHLPLHLPPNNLHGRFELNGKAPDIRARPREYYFAALEALDREIGRLLAGMPKAIRDNTLVIFLGDNGSPPQVAQSYRRNRTKGTVFEGGTHVPLIVWGRGVLRRGAHEKALVNTTDLFATIAELAGADLKKQKMPADSVSFAPLLSRALPSRRSFAYVELFGPATLPPPRPRSVRSPPLRRPSGGAPASRSGFAIRDARWKYLEEKMRGKMLFDLS